MSIRVAFIGTGGISAVHLDACKAEPDTQIVGLCDVSAENLEKRRAVYGGETFTDAEAMLDAVQPDAVFLCTPPTVRRDPLLLCARRGIPVMCEKPAERSLADARAIVTELAELDAKVQVAYVFRPTPLVQRLRDLLADDRIHSFVSTYLSNMARTMTFPAWFYLKEKSGGGLVDQATHNFDLLRYLLGEVSAVQGCWHNPLHPKSDTFTCEEAIGITLKFAAGPVGTHLQSWVAAGWKNEIVLHGEKRHYYISPMSWLRVQTPGEPEQYFESPEGSKYVYEDRLFLQAVRSGDWSRNPSPYADAVNTLAVTHACDRAVETGLTQTVICI